MATYSVVAHDGQLYGPADESSMTEWIRQGRVNRETVLHCHETNARTAAWTVPALQPALGLSPQQVAEFLQGAPGFVPPPASQHPAAGAPIDYASPRTYGGPTQPILSSFSTLGVVLLSMVTGLLFPFIYYGLIHGNLPKRRPDDPSAEKAIGFLYIPFFNLYWVCFFWVRLATRINDERGRVGLPPDAPRGLMIAILWCYLGLLIPLLNILMGIAIMVMLLISLIQLQGSINGLADATSRRR